MRKIGVVLACWLAFVTSLLGCQGAGVGLWAQPTMKEPRADLEVTLLASSPRPAPNEEPEVKPTMEYARLYPLHSPMPKPSDASPQGHEAASLTYRVKACFRYRDDRRKSQAIAWARVKLFDDELIGRDRLATAKTDVKGCVEFGPIDNEDGRRQGGRDIYVAIYLIHKAVKVKDLDDKQIYAFRTETKNNVRPKDIEDGYLDLGLWGPREGEEGAYHIFNQVVRGYRYVNRYDGASKSPPQVTAYWPDTDDDNESEHSENEIKIEGPSSCVPTSEERKCDPDQWDESVILHEYGHFIHLRYGDLYPPEPDYCHDPDELPPCDHSWFSHEDPQTAWMEGWATYFQAAVLGKSTYDDGDVHLSLEETWALADTVAYNDVEGQIAGILWDIHDRSDDDQDEDDVWDTISMGFDEIWKVFTKYDPEPRKGDYDHPRQIYDFWKGWFKEIKSHPQAMADIYDEHGISDEIKVEPKLRSPSQGAEGVDTRPSFKWRKNVGGATIWRIEVDNDQNFSSPEISDTVTSSEYRPDTPTPLEARTRYYWKVQAGVRVLEVNLFGPWSAVWNFKTAMPEPPAFTKHTIEGNFNGAFSVYATDVDADGDVDVLGAAYDADDITWWENDGSENFTKHTIAGNFDGARSVYATDVDGDGDVDVLGAAWYADDITWWENDGSENFTKHTIDGNFDGAFSVYATDVDGDRDVDVLGAAYDADDITWWENDGSENFTQHTIDGDFDEAVSVYAADVDADGDVDVLGAAYDADDITWWEQEG